MHALALADMNWRCGEVIVHGKGGEERRTRYSSFRSRGLRFQIND